MSADPTEWSDDDILFVLSRSGSDASGSLILGDPAYERWQQHKLEPAEPLNGARVGRAYARISESFRTIAAANARHLQDRAEHV